MVGAVCFSAALIVSQGILGLEIVAGGLFGGVALAYPLWRRWGRVDRPEDPRDSIPWK